MNRFIKSTLSSWPAIIISILVVGINVAAFEYYPNYKGHDFGLFSALGAVFSGLGFVVIAFTLIYQYKQFQSQREQFEKQSFENTFYGMLATQRELINQIEYVDKNNNPYRGRSLFPFAKKGIEKLYIFDNDDGYGKSLVDIVERKEFFYVCEKMEIAPNLYNNAPEKHPLDITCSFEEVKKYYDDKRWVQFISQVFFMATYITNYEHYFHHLYRILNFIKQNENTEKNRYEKYKNCVDTIKAQMSGVELFLLFYYGLSNPVIKELLEYYKVFENFDKELLLNPSHIEFYNFKKET